MFRVPVKPEMLRWARERAGLSVDDLRNRFAKLALWEREEAQPTFKQLEAFAKATYVPAAYFFLGEPPSDEIPIPDLRTIGNREVDRPSPNLLDAIYICQQRQAWYREHARAYDIEPLAFVESVSMDTPIEAVATEMRKTLNFDLDARRASTTWTGALRQCITQTDDAGVMVMVSSVVGSNNTRKLAVDEFRGFALADKFAPLVFINGTDTKAAQMFTLAHELAHIWLGENALTDASLRDRPSEAVEVWCNRVAAEFLVPLENLKKDMNSAIRPDMRTLARDYKVSALVILRRLFDVGYFDRQEFKRAYAAEVARLREMPASAGGNFYPTTGARVSKRFARGLVMSTLEGRTSFTDAFQLLGIKKMATFNELGRQLGVIA
ncbi:MAG: ImmA/IrrE family metallo-endopeptidase [Gammaproteobacteria bacterium]